MTDRKQLVVVAGAREDRFGGAWGKGDTVDAALAAAKEHGQMEPKYGYTVLTFVDGEQFQGVDDMGRYHYTGPDPAEVEIPATEDAS